MRSTLLVTLVLLGATPAMAGAQGPAPLGRIIPRPTATAEARRATILPRQVASIRRASPVARGALVGGLIGLGVGALAVASTDSDSGDSQVVLVVPAMAAIGAGVGAIIGALSGRR